jgi:hypothetical protein
VETTAVPGRDLAADQSFSLAADTSDRTISLTFVDPRQAGAIQVTKTAKHADPDTGPNLAATFAVKQGDTTVGTITTDAARALVVSVTFPREATRSKRPPRRAAMPRCRDGQRGLGWDLLFRLQERRI